jgi:outer membrane receptor protein involved in Fe transport
MKSSQLSEELRFTGPGADGILNWLAGFYFFKEDGKTTDIATLGSGLGSVVGPARTETTSYAAFGQVVYDITKKLGLTAGLRYTHENKTFQTDFRDVSTLAYELGLAGVPGLFERGWQTVIRNSTTQRRKMGRPSTTLIHEWVWNTALVRTRWLMFPTPRATSRGGGPAAPFFRS